MTPKAKGYFEIICRAPDTQIDKKITNRMRGAINTLTAADVKAILDECAYYALASDFGMRVMDVGWKILIAEEAVGE